MIKTAFERLLFASRFLLAPLYLALAISLLSLIGKTGLHLYERRLLQSDGRAS